MASTIGTSVVRDGSEEMAAVQKVIQLAEQLYQKHKQDKAARLAKELGDYLHAGGKAVFQAVDPKYQKDIYQRLLDENIPFSMLPGSNGEYMFVVGDNNKEAFENILEDVFQQSTEYYASHTPEKISKLYGRSAEKFGTSLSFKDEDAAQIAKEKLFQAGIVCAEIRFGAGEGKNGETVRLVISPNALFREKGRDLADFELDYALTQSYNSALFGGDPDGNKPSEFLDKRLAQAHFDEETLVSFAEAVKSGKNACLGNAKGGGKVYLSAEGGSVHVHRLVNGEWQEKTLDINLTAKNSDIIAMISRYTEEIRNMAVIDKGTFESYFTSGPINAQDVPQNVADIAKGYNRPKFDHGAPEESYQLAADEVRSALRIIGQKAARNVVLTAPKGLSKSELNRLKKEEILRMLEDKTDPVLQALFSSRPPLSGADMERWVDEVADHFRNEHENSLYECEVITKPTKDFQKEIDELIRQNEDVEVPMPEQQTERAQ